MAYNHDMAYSSGCGGPSYDWTADMGIQIGGVLPRTALPKGIAQWRGYIYDAAERYNLPPCYVGGIMSLESGGDPDAGSPAGAMGLMQLIHSTANAMAGRKLTVEEIYDPVMNLDLGCKFLRQLWDKYKGDPIKMAFGYNAGSARCGAGCVRDYKAPGRPCIAECNPNQFNLVADCYASTQTTVDYGGKVAAFSNEALLTILPVDRPSDVTGGEEPEESGGSSWGWLLVGGVAAVGAAVVGYAYPRKALPWQRNDPALAP